MGFSVPLHIPEVPDIKFPNIPLVTNYYKTIGYKDSARQHIITFIILQAYKNHLQQILFHPINIWWIF